MARDDSAAIEETLGLSADSEVTEAEIEAGDTSRVSGWRRVFRGNRMLWLVALGAVVLLVVGLLVGRFLIPPASAAEAPEPGLVTVPVQFGPLSNDVTIRADVGYADAVDVTVDTASVSGPAVVTGQVPEVGATLEPLSVALEIVGRPVIVLPGELPVYRTLRFGVSGPDVTQLKQSLAAVGINPGNVESNVFDHDTAAAIQQLYAQAGYPLPSPDEGAAEALASAEQGVAMANQQVATEQAALNAAGAGPSGDEQWAADVEVARAQLALDAARNQPPGSNGSMSVQEAEWALTKAERDRAALWAPKDTSAQRAALDSARAQVTAAQQALAVAQQAMLPYLPSSEVLYLTELPRRVDSVNVNRGSVISGAALTVSGATLRLTGTAAAADARLLTVGAEAIFDLPDGTLHEASISELNAPSGEGGRWEVLFDPGDLTAEQITQLQGSNVRVQISVGATDGDVLSVPFAALTAGPGGESRVQVVDSDPREGADATTRLVVVETGLAANGAVEVRPTEGTLEEGDLVVVGE